MPRHREDDDEVARRRGRELFEELAAVGISYDDVVQVLEDEGVDKFAASWQQLLETIKTEMAASGERE